MPSRESPPARPGRHRMRVSALLCGILLTAASGYVAQVAVQSAGLGRVARLSRDAADAPPPLSPPSLPPPAPIWSGGAVQPITLAVSRDTTPTLTPTPAVAGPEPFGASPRCSR